MLKKTQMRSAYTTGRACMRACSCRWRMHTCTHIFGHLPQILPAQFVLSKRRLTDCCCSAVEYSQRSTRSSLQKAVNYYVLGHRPSQASPHACWTVKACHHKQTIINSRALQCSIWANTCMCLRCSFSSAACGAVLLQPTHQEQYEWRTAALRLKCDHWIVKS